MPIVLTEGKVKKSKLKTCGQMTTLKKNLQQSECHKDIPNFTGKILV